MTSVHRQQTIPQDLHREVLRRMNVETLHRMDCRIGRVKGLSERAST